MSYNLDFDERAFKEWKKLGETIRLQFKKKLEKVLENPHIENNRLHSELNGCYKIKLRSSGYRLVYKVEDETVVVFVLAVGKRERNQAYDNASERLTKLQISSDANQ